MLIQHVLMHISIHVCSVENSLPMTESHNTYHTSWGWVLPVCEEIFTLLMYMGIQAATRCRSYWLFKFECFLQNNIWYIFCLIKTSFRAGEMVWQVNTLAEKSEDLNSPLRSTWWREKDFCQPPVYHTQQAPTCNFLFHSTGLIKKLLLGLVR